MKKTVMAIIISLAALQLNALPLESEIVSQPPKVIVQIEKNSIFATLAQTVKTALSIAVLVPYKSVSDWLIEEICESKSKKHVLLLNNIVTMYCAVNTMDASVKAWKKYFNGSSPFSVYSFIRHPYQSTKELMQKYINFLESCHKRIYKRIHNLS